MNERRIAGKSKPDRLPNKTPLICRAVSQRSKLPHPDAAPHGHPPHEDVVSTPNLIGQLLDIAAGQLRIDARAAGVLQLDLSCVKINHVIPLCQVLDPS
jgi:hypothetical protein